MKCPTCGSDVKISSRSCCKRARKKAELAKKNTYHLSSSDSDEMPRRPAHLLIYPPGVR